MHRFFLLLALLLGCAPLWAALPAQDGEGRPLPTLAPMLERAMPAVVNIATSSRVQVPDNPLLRDPFFRHFFGLPDRSRERTHQSLGSGVIVDADNGYVLTNHHVIDKAEEISVTLYDGRVLSATRVGVDPEADVAVIQIPAGKLSAMPAADSDRLRVGDFVVAIGNPFGLGQTVTSGIVSALGRSGLGIGEYEDLIQTDASINPGNSGGALVNLRGELVGINTAIIAPGGGNVGIGFAIPSNMAFQLMAQLVAYGEVRRGYLGIATQTLTPELAEAFGIAWQPGVIVSRVEPNSAAEAAGLQVGDVVVAADGRPVTRSADLRNMIGLRPAGDSITLELLRNGRSMTVTAEIAPAVQGRFEGGEVDHRLAGTVFDLIPEDSPYYGRIEGLMVLDIKSGSPAWYAGLREGDVVVSVNRYVVTTAEEMARAIGVSRQGILFNVRRGRRSLFVLVQ